LIINQLEARGVEPCFDDSYPRASEDFPLEGIREQGNRRGLLRMALDVITFVITSHRKTRHLFAVPANETTPFISGRWPSAWDSRDRKRLTASAVILEAG